MQPSSLLRLCGKHSSSQLDQIRLPLQDLPSGGDFTSKLFPNERLLRPDTGAQDACLLLHDQRDQEVVTTETQLYHEHRCYNQMFELP